MDNKELKVGDYVHYWPGYGKPENGRVKSVTKDAVFVVFHCDNDWENYQDYTGQNTKIDHLQLGWINEKINKSHDGSSMPIWKDNFKTCDHYYIPTNAKWQSATQRQCCHCGHIID
jgi:hypothetical protein